MFPSSDSPVGPVRVTGRLRRHEDQWVPSTVSPGVEKNPFTGRDPDTRGGRYPVAVGDFPCPRTPVATVKRRSRSIGVGTVRSDEGCTFSIKRGGDWDPPGPGEVWKRIVCLFRPTRQRYVRLGDTNNRVLLLIIHSVCGGVIVSFVWFGQMCLRVSGTLSETDNSTPPALEIRVAQSNESTKDEKD